MKQSSMFDILPDWIPKEAWSEFVKMRTKIKHPLTEYAMKLAINKLAELRDEGNDPQAVLDQSTFNSWQGLFAVKEKPSNGNGSRWTCKKCGKDWTPDHAC